MKTNKFSSSKEKYYKNIKTLLDKINCDIETKNSLIDNEEEGTPNNTENINININGNILLPEFDKKIKLDSPIEICGLCNLKEFKYTCPKCKVKYCGVDCYKTHNIECTEDFYKRNVEAELKNQKVEEDSSKKFRKNLKDYYDKINDAGDLSQNGSLSHDAKLSEKKEQHLLNILEKIENGTIDMNRDLTPGDWNEFNKFLNGYMEGSNINLYKPFWESKISKEEELEPSLHIYDLALFKDYDEKALQSIKEIELNEFIENREGKTNETDINDMEDLLESEKENINFRENDYITINGCSINITREIIYKSILLKYKDIPHLSNLSKIKPNFRNLNSLINITLHIVFLFRLYNGEINENINEIVSFLIENCKVLYEKEISFENVKIAINDFLACINKLGVSKTGEDNNINNRKYFLETEKMVIYDLKSILKNKFYIFESFLRLYEIIHKYSQDEKNINSIIIIFLYI